MSFSEIQIEDAPDVSQYRFLQSIASPGRTEKTMERRSKRFDEANGDNLNVEMSPDVPSPNDSNPTSTCQSMDEQQEQLSQLPKVTRNNDNHMIKHLNERPYDELRNSILSNDNTIPPFQGELPVKSMDVSEIGFRERYQSALTSSNVGIRNTAETYNNRVVRKSAIISMNRNSSNRIELQGNGHLRESGTIEGPISNDYYMLAAAEETNNTLTQQTQQVSHF